jgi:hypothetical protein
MGRFTTSDLGFGLAPATVPASPQSDCLVTYAWMLTDGESLPKHRIWGLSASPNLLLQALTEQPRD